KPSSDKCVRGALLHDLHVSVWARLRVFPELARLPRSMARTTKRQGHKSTSSASIGVEDVTALIRLMDENHLVEIEIERQGSKIRLVKGARSAEAPPAGAHLSGPGQPPVAHIPAPERTLEHCKAIISPMVGTFYRAS